MSYRVSTQVYIGLPADSLTSKYHPQVVVEMAEYAGVDISYAYDDILVVGYKVCSSNVYSYSELTGLDDLEEKKVNFKNVFGVEPKLILTVNIT